MDTRHELAMLAALAIVGGHPIVKVAEGERAIDPSDWYNPTRRPASIVKADEYERYRLSATFAGSRVYRGYR
jgi:hypothetical protein